MNQRKILKLELILIIGLIVTLTSCEKGDDGLTSLINMTEEQPGANCNTGGYKIETGIDSNKNGQLDIVEVQQTEYVCNGGSGSIINELRLKVSPGVGSHSVEGWVWSKTLVKFNILNYPGMDSVILVVIDAKTSDSSSNIIFDLYDITNDMVIENSEVRTNNTLETQLISSNIFSEFPKQEIDLGLKIRSEVDGVNGDCRNTYLFLYNSNN